MTKPILYDYWRSSASYRVRITLNLKNIPYDTISVNMLAGEQQQETYKAINPQGGIPSLQIGNKVYTQSMAIIEYLNYLYPTPNILGNTPENIFEIRRLSAVIACDIHPICNLHVVQKLESIVGDDSQKIPWMQHYIRLGLEQFEVLLKTTASTFCVGDSISMADCCLIPQLYNAHRWGVYTDDLALISHIHKNCLQLNAFKQATPEAVNNL